MPADETDLWIELILAFAAGVGATLGFQHGRRELKEDKKALENDAGGRLFLRVGAPIYGAFVGGAIIAFVIGMLLAIWQLLERLLS
jgi:hypothetical protein